MCCFDVLPFLFFRIFCGGCDGLCLHILLHLGQDLSTFTADCRIIQLQSYLHPTCQITHANGTPRNARTAQGFMVTTGAWDMVTHGHLIVTQGLFVLIAALTGSIRNIRMARNGWKDVSITGNPSQFAVTIPPKSSTKVGAIDQSFLSLSHPIPLARTSLESSGPSTCIALFK